MLNGCISKNHSEKKPQVQNVIQVKKVERKVAWKQKVRLSSKKNDCIDCVAAPINYSKPPVLITRNFTQKYKRPIEKKPVVKNKLKHYGAYGYIEKASDTTVKKDNYLRNKTIVSARPINNSSYGSYFTKSKNIAIQVGAFRNYRSAKSLLRRYSALSNNYNATIKKGMKNNKTLYRVRVEGFNNRSEAKKFMYSYGISDGFLVSK